MKLLISVLVLAVVSFGPCSAKATSLVCGDSSSSREISMVSPSSPPNLCEYTIEAKSKSVCQMRIDFSMSLAPPTLPSAKNDLQVPECTKEYVTIGDYILCGIEESQHLYIPINATAGIKSIDIKFKISQRKGSSKLPPLSWDVKVTQLECPAGFGLKSSGSELRRYSSKDGYLLAPAGCDQYYPEDQGIIRSFNYDDGKGVYPSNMNYVMCFARSTATVGLLIKAEDFNLAQESEGLTIFKQTDSNCYPQLPTEGRVQDYLMIPQAQVQEKDLRATYYCGHSLNGLSVLSTYRGPLYVLFNSGSVYKNTTKTLGFSLEYEILSDC